MKELQSREGPLAGLMAFDEGSAVVQIKPVTFELRERGLDDHTLLDLILQLSSTERLAILNLTNPNGSACDIAT